jgi:hypothetical protein
LSIPDDQIALAEKLLDSQSFLKREANEDFSIFTEHKRGSPRYRILIRCSLTITLFRAKQLGLDQLEAVIISKSQQSPQAVYSHEILETLQADAISSLPFPYLPFLFWGLCKSYCLSKDAMFAVAAEQLVDGANIDEAWCQKHMQASLPEESEFAMRLVGDKRSRMGVFDDEGVTCFLPDADTARKVLLIPGRG